MSTPTVLLILAFVAVGIYALTMLKTSQRHRSQVVLRPTEQVGRLDGEGYIGRKVAVATAEDEARLREAETKAAAAIHEGHNIDKADRADVPRDILGELILQERAHVQKKDLLAFSAEVEVKTERVKLIDALEAARLSMMAKHHNLKDMKGLLSEFYEERHRLEQKPTKTRADEDNLRLLNAAIPAFEQDFHGRLGQVTVSPE